MTTSDEKRWADKTVALRPETKQRLRAAQSYPDEPFWRIVERLLDEHNALHSISSPRAIPA